MLFFCDLTTLAPVAPVNDAEAHFFFLFIGSTLVLLTLFGLVMHLTRRKPPLEAEFATKAELKHEVSLINGTITHLDRRNEEIARQTFGKIDTLTSSMNAGFLETARAIGRLEGDSK